MKRQAAELGLVPHDHGESQDLCFVPDGDYAQFIARRHPELCRSGEIVDQDGRCLGQHSGYFRYTIGQRRGLGLGGGPWYVTDVIATENKVVVGRCDDLLSQDVRVKEVNWICRPPASGTILAATVQLRYNMQPVPAQVVVGPGDEVAIRLNEPVAAVTPGQAAVIYEGNQVLAGGWICGHDQDDPSDRTDLSDLKKTECNHAN